MVFNFKKNIVVGVSVTPDLGLEVAQVDFATKTVLKYGFRQLTYDNMRQEIADMDIFKETLQELLESLTIPKGTEIWLNLPTIAFKVTDYPASLNEMEVLGAIEEDLSNHNIFQNTEPCVAATALPSSTMQFTKVAYTAAQKSVLIEIAMQIKELGYKLAGIGTSVSSILNSLIYNERVIASQDEPWVLLIVNNNSCRILSMLGNNYIDSLEEKIAIGEVLEEEENYSIVTSAVNPLIANLPSKCLYVVSTNGIISAKALADKLVYNAQIIHQEANIYASAPFLETAPDVDEGFANQISLDVIGAAVSRDLVATTSGSLNMFNASLGDVFSLEQPPVLKFGSLSFVLSMPNMIVASVAVALVLLFVNLAALVPLNTTISQKQEQITKIKKDISVIQRYLDENKDISGNKFSESDEIRLGISSNKNLYSYYTIVGTEIPKKLWLTSLSLGKYTTIEGQADNLESVYSFFRNIKDYNPESDIKLQKLALATNSKFTTISEEDAVDAGSLITSMTADFYEFRISNAPEVKQETKDSSGLPGLMGLEPLE